MLRRWSWHGHDHRTDLIGPLLIARFVALTLLLAACTGQQLPAAVSVPVASQVVDANATVALIVDGDTIDVLIDGRTERIRLIGIDTPEIAHDPADASECFGPEATSFTTDLLVIGSDVRLERDIVGRDDYGRILAYVYRASDGILVNYEIVRRGYATPLSIAPNSTFAAVMVNAAKQAKADGIGLWGSCPG